MSVAGIMVPEADTQLRSGMQCVCIPGEEASKGLGLYGARPWDSPSCCAAERCRCNTGSI